MPYIFYKQKDFGKCLIYFVKITTVSQPDFPFISLYLKSINCVVYFWGIFICVCSSMTMFYAKYIFEDVYMVLFYNFCSIFDKYHKNLNDIKLKENL